MFSEDNEHEYHLSPYHWLWHHLQMFWLTGWLAYLL